MLFVNTLEDLAKKPRNELSRLVSKRKAALAKARLMLIRHEVHLSKVQGEDNGDYQPHIVRYAQYLVNCQKNEIAEREADLILCKALFAKAPRNQKKK